MALAVKIAATILCLLKKNLLTQKLSFNGKGQKGGKKKGPFLKTFPVKVFIGHKVRNYSIVGVQN